MSAAEALGTRPGTSTGAGADTGASGAVRGTAADSGRVMRVGHCTT